MSYVTVFRYRSYVIAFIMFLKHFVVYYYYFIYMYMLLFYYDLDLYYSIILECIISIISENI